MASRGSDLPRISVLLPTRARPAMARAFLDSLAATARRPDLIEVVLYVDDDDPASAAITHPTLHLVTIVGPPVAMGAANTACLARARGDILVLANDDVVVQTEGWDEVLAGCGRRFTDGIYL